jgi:drug/metabolite transporter (DMT)-like permease
VQRSRRAELYLLAVTIVWGSTFVVTKSIIPDNSPLFYTGIRFLLASLILWAVAPRRILGLRKPTVVAGIVLGTILYAGFALQTVGIQYTTASKSAFLTGMMVVLTPLAQFLAQRWFGFRPRLLRLGNILGVILAAIGLYFLTSPSGGSFTVGDAMTLACAACFAVYVVYLDHVSALPDKLLLTLVQFIVCAILGFASAFLFEEIRVTVTTGYVFSQLYLTIMATVVAMWVQNQYQGDTTPTRAAVVFSMEPVVAGIFAFAIRGEVIGVVGCVGAGLILSGLGVSEFAEEFRLLRRTVGE